MTATSLTRPNLMDLTTIRKGHGTKESDARVMRPIAPGDPSDFRLDERRLLV